MSCVCSVHFVVYGIASLARVCVSMLRRSILDYIRTKMGMEKNYLTKIYEVLTSIKWQKVAYTFDMLFFSFPEWNIHIFNFVCRVFRLQVTVYGISRSRRKVKMKEKYRKKWRINVFAEKSTEYCRRDCCLCDFPPQPLLCY